MLEFSVYKCEYCGQQFDNEDKCAEHESKHTKIDSIFKVFYDSISFKGKMYPSAISVKLSDGKVLTYNRVHEL